MEILQIRVNNQYYIKREEEQERKERRREGAKKEREGEGQCGHVCDEGMCVTCFMNDTCVVGNAVRSKFRTAMLIHTCTN